jgi:hypothetical protein
VGNVMCFPVAYSLAQEGESAKKGIIETMYNALQKEIAKRANQIGGRVWGTMAARAK